MDSEGTETSRRNDSVGQDIRAGFGFLWILRVILDRAALLIATLQDDPSYLEQDKSMRVPPSSMDHSIIHQLVTEAPIFMEVSGTSILIRRDENITSMSPKRVELEMGLHPPSLRHAERATMSGLSGDGSMIDSSPSVVTNDLIASLCTVQGFLSSMETQVAGPIFCYQPILEQQDGNLLMIAMGIERNLDMLEYHQVKKDENTSIRIFNHLKHLLQSILPVLSTTFEEYLVSMNLKRATSVLQRPGGLTAPIMPNLDNIRSQLATASPSVEMQNQSGMEETIETELVEKGQDGIYLLSFLLSNEAEDFVIPIKNAYKNSRVKGHFDVRVWVNVSCKSTMIVPSKVSLSVPCCINELMNAHVMNSDNRLPPVHSDEFTNWIIQNLFSVSGGSRKAYDHTMKDLEKVIQCGLSGKKFLLVLHGVSEDQMAQWDHLFRSIKSGCKGSKIIVVTTSANVEKSVRNVNILQSDEDENNVSWRFFRNYAFDSFNIDGYQVELGIEMATLLRRFPIAMKMIGCLLKNNSDKKFWESVYRNIVQIVIDGKEADDPYQLLSLLKLCYDQLPAPVGLCFSYCSLYPKGWRFTAQSLIHFWMSDGITEDIGRGFFYCLHSRGFFELLKLRGRPSASCYVMHSAIHRLEQLSTSKSTTYDPYVNCKSFSSHP